MRTHTPRQQPGAPAGRFRSACRKGGRVCIALLFGVLFAGPICLAGLLALPFLLVDDIKNRLFTSRKLQ